LRSVSRGLKVSDDGEVKQRKLNPKLKAPPLTIVVGTYIAPPNGGGVTVKKGEAVWLFLERARHMSG
jgi:protein FAM50